MVGFSFVFHSLAVLLNSLESLENGLFWKDPFSKRSLFRIRCMAFPEPPVLVIFVHEVHSRLFEPLWRSSQASREAQQPWELLAFMACTTCNGDLFLLSGQLHLRTKGLQSLELYIIRRAGNVWVLSYACLLARMSSLRAVIHLGQFGWLSELLLRYGNLIGKSCNACAAYLVWSSSHLCTPVWPLVFKRARPWAHYKSTRQQEHMSMR